MIDITKPVKTRDGRVVTLISDIGRSICSGVPQPLMGYVEDKTLLYHWCRDGRYAPKSVDQDLDLVQEFELWVNVYSPSSTGTFKTYEEACAACKNVVARVKVAYTVGQFDTP